MVTYLKQFFVVVTLLFVSVAVINWGVDPFAIWHNKCLKNINGHKTEAGDKIYLTKAYQWHHIQPEIIVLGNSRPELGLNPESPYFKEQNVYNLAIRGAGIITQVEYLLYLLEQKKTKRVIMSVDFLDLIQSADGVVQWPPNVERSSNLPMTLMGEKNTYYPLNNAKSHLSSLFSLDSLLASLKTVVYQQSKTNYTKLDGFNQADGFIPIVNNEGIWALFEEKEQGLRQRLTGKDYALYDSTGVSTGFNTLFLLIKELEKQGIQLDLFVSPFHQQYLYILESTGHFNLYLEWKKGLVKQLSEAGFFSKNRLLDFSGFNRYSSEVVPTERGVFMKWYWEPSHYREELGEVVIEHTMTKNAEFELSPENADERQVNEKALLKRFNVQVGNN
ncbi:hypothetical protein [Neptunomonas qingdaonensis]|uniref:Uncharacterized protein n=1 Tax=Neptunomonas qingdaonensis TaxID=1045558 RepID=A0A1I2MVU5_9GAMM|nr:hypothetical protein [Neptunomonas qingdaonensis]SFF94779.1 hypothetical protein SAMN05216175_10282 [Neptunomonas qingdaonensis]